MSGTPRIMCRDRGFAGPTCCILEKGHAGEHRYDYPKISTREEQLETELAAAKDDSGRLDWVLANCQSLIIARGIVLPANTREEIDKARAEGGKA